MQPAITDEQILALVPRCQAAEQAAIEAVYHLYGDRLYRYLLARTGDPDTAADLSTELFVRMLQHIAGFRLDQRRPAASFSGWLYRAPMLAVVAQLSRLAGQAPAAAQRQRTLARLRQEAATQRASQRGQARSGWLTPIFAARRLAVAAAVVLLLLATLSAGVVASSQPGEPAYGLRVIVERAPALVLFNSPARTAAELDIADRRQADLQAHLARAGLVEAAALRAMLAGDQVAARQALDGSERERLQVIERLTTRARLLAELAESTGDPAAAQALTEAVRSTLAWVERLQASLTEPAQAPAPSTGVEPPAATATQTQTQTAAATATASPTATASHTPPAVAPQLTRTASPAPSLSATTPATTIAPRPRPQQTARAQAATAPAQTPPPDHTRTPHPRLTGLAQTATAQAGTPSPSPSPTSTTDAGDPQPTGVATAEPTATAPADPPEPPGPGAGATQPPGRP